MNEYKEFTSVKVKETGEQGVIVDKRFYNNETEYTYTVEFSDNYPPHHLKKFKYNELELVKE